MTSRSGAALVCAAAAVFALAGTARADDAATALLRKAFDAPTKVTYVGEVQSMRFGQNRSEVEIYRVEHQAPNLTHRWYLAPRVAYGDSVITRGDTSYTVDMNKNVIVVSKDDAIDDRIAVDNNFTLLTANYRASFGPDDSAAGRMTHVIVFENAYTGETTMRLWIDTHTGVVLKKEIYGANGSLIAAMRFTSIRYVPVIPSDMFSLPRRVPTVQGGSHGAPINNLSVAMKSAGFSVREPRYLPEGFQPLAADVSDVSGVRTCHILYSDGIRTISLFENARDAAVNLTRFREAHVRFEDHDGVYAEDGPTLLLAWSESGLHYTLVGDLALGELTRIAASVVP